MNYEVWNITTDRHVGDLEVGNPIEHTDGAKVIVKVKGELTCQGQSFNAVEMRVCRMRDKHKKRYYALETGLPIEALLKLEGFTPRIIVPSVLDIRRVQ